MKTNRVMGGSFRLFLLMALWLSPVLLVATAGAAQLPSQPSSLQTRPGGGPFKAVSTVNFKAKVKSGSSLKPKKGSNLVITNIQKNQKANLNSTDEPGDVLAQEVQMTMDNRSKAVETLSNVSKNMDKTSDQIVKT
jgi:hypothetical protein